MRALVWIKVRAMAKVRVRIEAMVRVANRFRAGCRSTLATFPGGVDYGKCRYNCTPP